jgi:hypothetical protein
LGPPEESGVVVAIDVITAADLCEPVIHGRDGRLICCSVAVDQKLKISHGALRLKVLQPMSMLLSDKAATPGNIAEGSRACLNAFIY